MDLLELLNAKKRTGNTISTKGIAALHEFYLSGEIQDAAEYTDVFDTIRHAGENDVVKIYINSVGGDLFTAIQFLRVLSETNATTIASVEGACMSAATMIFMACDNYEVTPHSVFMHHTYSSGAVGKGGEMYAQISHQRKWSENLLHEIYKDFLSKEEIESMLEGKDIWMDGDEVIDRIQKRIKKQEEAEKKEEKKLASEALKGKKLSKKSVQE